jgi:hypothetical protein
MNALDHSRDCMNRALCRWADKQVLFEPDAQAVFEEECKDDNYARYFFVNFQKETCRLMEMRFFNMKSMFHTTHDIRFEDISYQKFMEKFDIETCVGWSVKGEEFVKKLVEPPKSSQDLGYCVWCEKFIA